MEALLENKNILGYILLVAILALLILRLQASRRRDEEARARRRPAARIVGQGEPAESEPSEEADDAPARFDKARLQFYVMIAAAIALVIGYLLRRHS